MSAQLLEAPRATEALSKVINQIHRLQQTEKDIIALLPSLSDDEVIDTRTSARLLYCSAWKIEVACDAEIWERVKTNLSKSGVRDVDEKGILAAVNKRADDLGCSARTVYLNRQIYDRFHEPIASGFNGLDEKGFYQAALTSPDPDAAIEMFAEKRSNNPRYRVADAWRDLEDEKGKTEKRVKEVTDAIRSEQRKALAYHIEFEAMPAVIELQTKCSSAKFSSEFWGEVRQQLQDRLEDMATGDFRSLLIKVWNKGFQTEEQMVAETNLPASEVRRVMLTLEEDGDFVEKHLEWKPAQARGQRSKVWRRTDKPLPI